MSWQFGGQFLCKIGSMAMESMCICGNSHSSCKLEISMVKAKVFNSVSLLSFQKQVCLLSSSYHSLRLAIKIETVSKNMTTIYMTLKNRLQSLDELFWWVSLVLLSLQIQLSLLVSHRLNFSCLLESPPPLKRCRSLQLQEPLRMLCKGDIGASKTEMLTWWCKSVFAYIIFLVVMEIQI